jgi:uncharacterized protein (UPF0276 family)
VPFWSSDLVSARRDRVQYLVPTFPLAQELGVGVVWWPPLDALCRDHEGLVDVIEAEPEAYWIPTSNGSGFRSMLAGALAHLPQPKLLHGVGAPLAGTCPPSDGHAATFAADVAALSPEHVSEHLSFTRFQSDQSNKPTFAGFMLPPLQSTAGVQAAAANIRRYRKAIGGIPFAVETPVNYLPPIPGEWPDGNFVAAVAEAADCGILLDLHNALCNARNGRQTISEFCNALPLERVWELHIAGGEHEVGFYVDAHSGLAGIEVMEIAAALVPKLPRLRAIIFEIMPERVAEVGLAAIGRQLGQIKEIWNTRPTVSRCYPKHVDLWPGSEPALEPSTWVTLLGAAVSGVTRPQIDERLKLWWDSAAPAIDLYRFLIGEGRASAIAAAAPHTTRLLLKQHGSTTTRRFLMEFWRQTPQGYTAMDEARAFLQFLSAIDGELPGLAEAAAQDMAVLTALYPDVQVSDGITCTLGEQVSPGLTQLVPGPHPE